MVPSPPLILPPPALITYLRVNRFPNKLTPNVPYNLSRNAPFCSFGSFSVISLTLFINKQAYSTDFHDIFIYFFMYFHDIIHFFIYDYQCSHT